MKVQVYCRKGTHTDQYLSFRSHQVLNHKLEVIHTLYDQCDNIVIHVEEADVAAEIIHVDKVLGRCGYPKWSFRRVRESIEKKKQEARARKKKKEECDRDTKTTVTIPYIKGVLEVLSQAFQHHGVATAMKPHLTLKRMLVHPKVKRTPQENAGVVCQIPCKDCPGVYILVRRRGSME